MVLKSRVCTALSNVSELEGLGAPHTLTQRPGTSQPLLCSPESLKAELPFCSRVNGAWQPQTHRSAPLESGAPPCFEHHDSDAGAQWKG